LSAQHPTRFKGFASIPMDDTDAALKELHRAIDELKMNGVILLSNIRGKALTSPGYRPFFAEANRMKLCILHRCCPRTRNHFANTCCPIVGSCSTPRSPSRMLRRDVQDFPIFAGSLLGGRGPVSWAPGQAA
jgi:predicted TIM-barrel fold metal-dependent hydrolase